MTHPDARRNLEPLADAATGVLAVGALLAGIAIGVSGPLFHVELAPGLVGFPSEGGLAFLGAGLIGGISTLAVVVALGAGRRPYLGVAVVVASASLLVGIIVGGRLGSAAGAGGWSAGTAATPSPTPLTEPGWAMTGSMVQARRVLADGRILLAGGVLVSSPRGWGLKSTVHASAHLYDPRS